MQEDRNSIHKWRGGVSDGGVGRFGAATWKGAVRKRGEGAEGRRGRGAQFVLCRSTVAEERRGEGAICAVLGEETRHSGGGWGEAVAVTDAERRAARRQQVRVATWARLARVYHEFDRASAELLRRWDLSVAQFDVLAQIGAREGLTQQELAERLLVTKGNVSQIIARMARDGLVRRSQQGRTSRLYLTDAGRALYARVVPEKEAMIVARFAALTDAELLALAQGLRVLRRGNATGIATPVESLLLNRAPCATGHERADEE